MLHILRRIRQKLINDKKILNYLLYAIGEMLLVVMGIIIALQINNSNEAKKNDIKFQVLLSEVKKDLEYNISSNEDLLKFYIKKDSIFTDAQTKSLTKEDYESTSLHSFRHLLFNRMAFKLKKIGYDNLIRNLENVPDRYDDLLKELSKLYEEKAAFLVSQQEAIKEGNDLFINDLSKTKSWFYLVSEPGYHEEMVEYFLNDPFYKNALELNKSNINTILNISSEFQQHAVEVYTLLLEYLKDPGDIPDRIQSILNPTYEWDYSGLYSYVDKGREIIFDVKKGEGKFTFSMPNGPAIKLLYLGKHKFMALGSNIYFKFEQDSIGQPLLNFLRAGEIVVFTKKEE